MAAVALAAVSALAATVDRTKAAEVKAAYLKHIAALTTWPEGKLGAADRPIVIGVLGPDPNGVMAPIRARIQSRDGLQAQGRRLELLDMDSTGELPDAVAMATALEACDVLFLSADAEREWARVQPLLGRRPIVTVGEIDSFARRGGMIEYLLDVDDGKVHLIVNLDAIQRAGIVLSARLLALQNVVVLRGEAAR
jgi:YfiR/HmsC-like